jgi:F-type H+-transporting ATPase subunit alpha
MEVFTQFSSDLDDVTKRQLTYGQGLMRLLRQNQYHPLKQHEQVILLLAALDHVMQEVPLDQMDDFRQGLLEHIRAHAPQICQEIDQTGQLSDEAKQEILDLAHGYQRTWAPGKGA